MQIAHLIRQQIDQSRLSPRAPNRSNCWLRYRPPSARPLERIEGIKIVQMDGLSAGHNGHGYSDGSAPHGNLAEQVVSSVLRYRVQAPLVESPLQEIGLTPVISTA